MTLSKQIMIIIMYNIYNVGYYAPNNTGIWVMDCRCNDWGITSFWIYYI